MACFTPILRKYPSQDIGYFMNPKLATLHTTDGELFQQRLIRTTSNSLLEFEPNRQAYLFPFAWFPLESHLLLQRFYKQRVFYWCLPWGTV